MINERSRKKHVKYIFHKDIFLKNKKAKGEKWLKKDIKILLKKKKKQGVSVIRIASRNYLSIEKTII